jgi:hypothetical protein
LALDQGSGDLYVADLAAGTVEKFDSAHAPLAFGGTGANIEGNKLTGFSFAPERTGVNAMAVSPVSHDLFVTNPMKSVRAFRANGEPALFSEGPGAGTNEIPGLANICGVAVDVNGDIYASDFFAGIEIYSPAGKLLTTIPTFATCNVAVAAGGLVYAAEDVSPVSKFAPSEFPVTEATTYSPPVLVDEHPSYAVAVDPSTNHLFVDEHTRVAEYEEGAATPLETFGATGRGALSASEGIAVNTAVGHLYVSDAEGERQVEKFGPAVLLATVGTGEASEIKAHSATLNGMVDPEGVNVGDCHFDYGTSTAYGQSAPCEQTVGSGSGEVAVTAKVTGLTPGSTYHFRLVAANAAGAAFGSDAVFATPPPPSITGETVTNLAEKTAELNANVNPHGEQLEGCRFEYGTEAGVYPEGAACSPDAAQVPADTSAHPVSAAISGLQHDTPYHWRVVASSPAGTTTTVDHTFVYPTTGGGRLPDGRAYEMVTPARKNGALLGSVILGLTPDLAENGSRITLSTLQCFVGGSCPAARAKIGTPYAFTRTSEGWLASSLAPSATEYPINSAWSANANDATALFSMPTGPTGGDEFYTRSATGSFTPIGPVVSPELGAQGATEADGGAGEWATEDFSRFIYAESTISRNWWPFDESEGATLYEYSGHASHPSLVGVSGSLGTDDLISTCGTVLGRGEGVAGVTNEALSGKDASGEEGTTVYFTAERCPAGGTGANKEVPVPADELYARVGGAAPLAISERSATECNGECSTSPTGNASFAGASADGTKAFFMSTQQLTDAASQDGSAADKTRESGGNFSCYQAVNGSGCNLYEYDFTRPAGQRLAAISAGDSSGFGPRVQGVLAIAKSGERVYFVAKGVLNVAANASGETARDGAENLYVFERDEAHPEGRTRFVATLAASDTEAWTGGPPLANVTEDGRFLVFTSHRALTPDDSRGESGPAQVFRYDALTGELVRVSIGEGGFNDNGNAGVGDATIVPALSFLQNAGSATRNPTMTDDGAGVFFMSPVGLTANALNDVPVGKNGNSHVEYAQNIYEYHAGHVYLISDGRDVGVEPVPECSPSISDVCLVGVSGSGHDVFFTTSDQLVPGDTDTQLDYYDARVCEPASPCLTSAPPPLPPCAGEACHGIPPATPGAPSGGSATFNGAGNVAVAQTGGPVKPACSSSSGAPSRGCTRRQNLTKALAACKRRFPHSRKKRGTCERAARHAYPAKAAKKATHRR